MKRNEKVTNLLMMIGSIAVAVITDTAITFARFKLEDRHYEQKELECKRKQPVFLSPVDRMKGEE